MTREQLIASLTVTDNDVLFLDGGAYFDWSCSTGGGDVRMEVGDGTDAVQLDMTREDMVSLQQRLTAWLLADAA